MNVCMYSYMYVCIFENRNGFANSCISTTAHYKYDITCIFMRNVFLQLHVLHVYSTLYL